MGRGLSALQATILVLAYRNHRARVEHMAALEEGSFEYHVLTEGVGSVDLYYAEVLYEYFGFDVRNRYWSPERGERPTWGAELFDAKHWRAPLPECAVLAFPRRRAARGSWVSRASQGRPGWT